MIEPNKMKPPLNKMHHTTRYLLLDLISSIIGWLFLSFYRKNLMYQGIYDFSTLSNMIFNDINFYKGVIIIPFIFIGIFALSDSYREVYRRSHNTTIAVVNIKMFFNYFDIIHKIENSIFKKIFATTRNHIST
jgi:hypothetical protein